MLLYIMHLFVHSAKGKHTIFCSILSELSISRCICFRDRSLFTGRGRGGGEGHETIRGLKNFDPPKTQTKRIVTLPNGKTVKQWFKNNSQLFLQSDDNTDIMLTRFGSTQKYMLFTEREVRMGNNCVRGLEYSRPRAQFFPIRTDLAR